MKLNKKGAVTAGVSGALAIAATVGISVAGAQPSPSPAVPTPTTSTPESTVSSTSTQATTPTTVTQGSPINRETEGKIRKLVESVVHDRQASLADDNTAPHLKSVAPEKLSAGQASEKANRGKGKVGETMTGSALDSAKDYIEKAADAETSGRVRIVAADANVLSIESVTSTGPGTYTVTGIQDGSTVTKTRGSSGEWREIRAYAKSRFEIDVTVSGEKYLASRYDFTLLPEYRFRG